MMTTLSTTDRGAHRRPRPSRSRTRDRHAPQWRRASPNRGASRLVSLEDARLIAMRVEAMGSQPEEQRSSSPVRRQTRGRTPPRSRSSQVGPRRSTPLWVRKGAARPYLRAGGTAGALRGWHGTTHTSPFGPIDRSVASGLHPGAGHELEPGRIFAWCPLCAQACGRRAPHTDTGVRTNANLCPRRSESSTTTHGCSPRSKPGPSMPSPTTRGWSNGCRPTVLRWTCHTHAP